MNTIDSIETAVIEADKTVPIIRITRDFMATAEQLGTVKPTV
ncbi:hypothetical protein FDG2_1417 [Candidatus Protofrankia californiensis]|uniref:Uncharacterized protein n=1 Tax=Candidatus Protofrankia californiensis TaxID=1839754 RepID=A0A1C3NVJ9_9ACTN|nr:hypothetical protein FDG2_1417 [Candidatus Protofrankia californiensis]